MQQLFENFSISEIIIFLIMLALATKELVTFIDWIKERTKKPFIEENEEMNNKKETEERLIELEKIINEIKEYENILSNSINQLTEKINTLITSDKDDIKAYITEKHHYFCYEQKQIDDYSLECLERRYATYKKEGGNSFIDDLMSDIRNLPKFSKIK